MRRTHTRHPTRVPVRSRKRLPIVAPAFGRRNALKEELSRYAVGGVYAVHAQLADVPDIAHVVVEKAHLLKWHSSLTFKRLAFGGCGMVPRAGKLNANIRTSGVLDISEFD